MTSLLSRLAFGLSLSVAGLALVPAAMAQTADGTAPGADVSMGVPEGAPPALPDQAHAEVGKVYLAATFDSFEQRCVKTQDGADPCQLYQLLKDQGGNPTAEVSFFALPQGGQAVMGATILAPLETLLTANLRIAIDQAPARVYPYSYCNPAGCIAKVGFTADDVAAMKKGAAANLTIVPAAAPDKTVAVQISLKGFSAAYQAIRDMADKAKK